MKLRTLTADSTEPSAPRTPRSPARPLLSIVVPTKNEAGNVADLVARLEAVVPDRRDGDHLRGREHRRHARVHRGDRPALHARGRAPAPDARTRPQRPRGSGRPGTARREGSVGLRDGRRPAAPTRADRVAARAGRVLRPRPRRREPLLRERLDRLRLGARDGLSLHDGRSAAAVSAAPSQRHGSHERLLPGAPRCDRRRRAAAARVQDPARAVDPHAWRSGAPRCRSRSANDTPVAARRRSARGCATCRCSRACGLPASGSSAPQVSSSTPSLLAVLTDVVGLFYVVSAVIATQGRRCGTSASPSSGSSPIARTSEAGATAWRSSSS